MTPHLARPAGVVFACATAFLLAACSASSSTPPAPKPTHLSDHAREVAAMTAWDHSDADMLYQQTIKDLAAWQKAEKSGNAKVIAPAAVTLWQDAGITARTPPPVGTAQWSEAMKDLAHAAQLAGGDPGAPTGTDAQVERWLKRFDRHIAAASAAVSALES